MTQIDLFTGFLGAGKTTLLNKLLPVMKDNGQTLAIIENDFGDIPVDSQLLSAHGVGITEMSAGCICCSLVGDLVGLLRTLVSGYAPDRILIEPSGISRTSDLLKAVESIERAGLARRGRVVNLVDCGNFEDYRDSFGSFFVDQMEQATCNLLTHGGDCRHRNEIAAEISALNPSGVCFTGDWLPMDAALLYDWISEAGSVPRHPSSLESHSPCHGHHPSDSVFSSWSTNHCLAFAEDGLTRRLKALSHGYGSVLRAKGVVDSGNGFFLHFDYLPGHLQVRRVSGTWTPVVTVIGQSLAFHSLEHLFCQSKGNSNPE